MTNLDSPRGARKLVESYGEGGFRIGGVRHEGSVLLFADATLPWAAHSPGEVRAADLRSAIEARRVRVRILVVGCGAEPVDLPMELVADLRTIDVGVEWMTTGAACRTYNVLRLEEREVAAALLAVG